MQVRRRAPEDGNIPEAKRSKAIMIDAAALTTGARNWSLSVLPNSFANRLTSRRPEAVGYRLTHSRDIDVAGSLLCKHFG
jgi:hypothetical protein